MPVIKNKIQSITAIYWFLLVYILAALVWWFVSLDRQNDALALAKLAVLKTTDDDYQFQKQQILDYRRRKEGQYIGEGVIFFAFILVVAVFVYRSIRNQLRLGQQQRNFMMAVTHELKTPIAVARINIETLLKHQLPQDQQALLLQQTLQETNRLNDLCNNILFASRFHQTISSYLTPLNFSLLVTEVVQQFEQRYPKRIFVCSIEPNCQIMGDRLHLQLLISNLLDNAVKYSPTQEPINVSIKAHQKSAVMTIADRGVGIAPAERKRVFRQFYRIGNEATRQQKGTGLGLFLVAKIAEEHQAKIRLSDNQPTGSQFTFTIPLA